MNVLEYKIKETLLGKANKIRVLGEETFNQLFDRAGNISLVLKR